MRSTRPLVFVVAVFALVLSASWCFAAVLQTGSSLQTSQTPPPKKQSDAEIQKCIQDKLAASEIKNQSVQVTVGNGEAVLTGNLLTAAHKNTAGQIAKGCGAHKYVLRKTRP